MTKTPPQVEIHPVVLKLKPVINLTDDQLFQLCQLNSDWRIEYTAQGELIVMPSTGGETGNRNAEITFQVLSKYYRGQNKIRPVSHSIHRAASSSPTAPYALPMPLGSDAFAWRC